MALNDLLVSYKRIETPSRTIPEFKFPESYQLVTSDAPQSKPDQEDVQTPKYYTSTVQRPKFSSIQRWNSPYRDRNAWITDLAAAYRKAGVTNDNAIKMLIAQDAQESGWGRSAQGKFNFGNLTTGAKWKGDYVRGNDHDAKGNPIKQKFRSYNSMDEYAADKLQFLKHLYDFDENDDINTFTAKLTGKNRGKRRYAEATDYADRVAAVFRSFKNGGVIRKYQQAGTIVADNTRVAKPVIQEKIQRTYQISEQPQFVQDNRSDWSENYKQQENEALYNNQHLWNWSAPFNNTRVTKDNARAMFDFNKSAGMSTFAVGTGIANPVATATSMAGSMVGAGIGNEVAGEKGSIVGGLVGGLVNPKIKFRRSSTKPQQQGSTANNVNIYSKMNFDNYDQIIKTIDNEEELYRLYLQNETVAKRIGQVSPSYKDIVDEFARTKITKRLGELEGGNFRAVNQVADDAPDIPLGGIPFKYQENIYNIKPGETVFNKEFVAHENSHGIDRAMNKHLNTSYLRGLLNPSDKLPFHKWIDKVKGNNSIAKYIKEAFNGLDVNNPTDYPKIEKQIYDYFSNPTEIKAYFSRIPFEKYKKSVDRSFDGKIINNPVSEDIFQITDADILNDIRLQLISSIYRRKPTSYESLKENLSNKIWGISALGIPAVNVLMNGYE